MHRSIDIYHIPGIYYTCSAVRINNTGMFNTTYIRLHTTACYVYVLHNYTFPIIGVTRIANSKHPKKV